MEFKTLLVEEEGTNYIITDDMRLEVKDLADGDVRKHCGWRVNVVLKTLSPYLPILVLKSDTGAWYKPDRQLSFEDIKECMWSVYKYSHGNNGYAEIRVGDIVDKSAQDLEALKTHTIKD